MEMDKDLIALVAEYKRVGDCMEIMDDDDPMNVDCALAQREIVEQLMDRLVAEWQHHKEDPDAWLEEPLWLTRTIYAAADEMRDAWLDDVQADAIEAATEGNPDYLAHLDEDLDDDSDGGFDDFLDESDYDMPFDSGDDPLF